MRYFCLFLLSCLLLSCDQPGCDADQLHPRLQALQHDAVAFQAELRQMIQEADYEVGYYFTRRETKAGRDLLILNAYGADFCGELWVEVRAKDPQVDRLQNNVGRHGAGLRDFRWEEKDQQAVYVSLRGLID
ncbi:MAG: hypothetical protein AAFR61_18760 [Bacteroidota bacterium]